MTAKYAPCLDCWAVVDLGGAMCLTGELEPTWLHASTGPVTAARRLPSREICVDTANGDSYVLGEPSQLFLARYPTGAQRIYDLVGKESGG